MSKTNQSLSGTDLKKLYQFLDEFKPVYLVANTILDIPEELPVSLAKIDIGVALKDMPGESTKLWKALKPYIDAWVNLFTTNIHCALIKEYARHKPIAIRISLPPRDKAVVCDAFIKLHADGLAYFEEVSFIPDKNMKILTDFSGTWKDSYLHLMKFINKRYTEGPFKLKEGLEPHLKVA